MRPILSEYIKKRTILLSFQLLVISSIIGQVANVDSLVNLLETQKLTVKQRLELHKEICENYRHSSFEKCMLFAESGLKLAEKEKDKKMIGYFCNRIGALLMEQSASDSSLVYLNRSLLISQENKDIQTEARNLNNIGSWYHKNDKKEEALDYYLRSLALFEKIGDCYYSAHTLLNISNFYISMEQSEQSLYYIKRAQEYPETINNPELNSFLYYLLLGYYYKNKDNEKALENGLISLDICRKQNLIRLKISTLQVLIDICLRIKDYENAEKYALESLEVFESIWDNKLYISTLNVLAILYLNTNRFQEGKDIALKSWNMDSVSFHARNTAGILSNIYLYLGDNERVMYFSLKHDSLRSKFTESQFLESLSAMEVKYETEKKELRIAALEKERKLYILLGIACSVLAIGMGVVLWLSMRNLRKEKQLIATRSLLDGVIKERSRLSKDIHDRVSGNLSAMKLKLNNHVDSLQDVRNQLDNCIREIRDVAHDLMPPSLQYGLKVALENFTTHFPNVDFHFFGVEKRIDERMEYVVYCCANELVNNAVIHSGAKKINLQLIQDDRRLTLTVSDDGCGFNEKTVKNGIGLESVKSRVAACNGKIDIDTCPGKGTETTIELRVENSPRIFTN